MPQKFNDLVTKAYTDAQKDFLYYAKMRCDDFWVFCESPIEVLLGVAIQNYVLFHYAELLNPCEQENVRRYINKGDVWLLVPQYKIGHYRFDFALFFNGKEQLFIECDGHNFHERTKEQATRDRKKDRFVQGINFPILRFTGSEIYRDSYACASEIIDFVFRSVE